jgi:hypothetical protein
VGGKVPAIGIARHGDPPQPASLKEITHVPKTIDSRIDGLNGTWQSCDARLQ